MLIFFDSIWRPVASPVEDWPLAVCDGSTVKQSNLVEADVVRRDNVSSNMFLTYEKDHKWHYLEKHRADEVLIFKQFDTRTDVNARCKLITSVLPSIPSRLILVQAVRMVPSNSLLFNKMLLRVRVSRLERWYLHYRHLTKMGLKYNGFECSERALRYHGSTVYSVIYKIVLWISFS